MVQARQQAALTASSSRDHNMPTATVKADYPDNYDEAREEAVFAENAQRMAQALVDRGYKNVEVKSGREELSLQRESPDLLPFVPNEGKEETAKK